MSITDELREYTEKQIKWLDMTKVHYRKLFAIADRIDAAHEKAIASVMNDALYHANDKDMADLGWVRLPVDADGEYIHVGDVMEWPDGSDDPFEVVGIGTGTLYYMYDDSCEWTQASTKRHYKQPTVEDVLREMCLEIDRRCERGSIDYDKLFADYAAKLRLVGDE